MDGRSDSTPVVIGPPDPVGPTFVASLTSVPIRSLACGGDDAFGGAVSSAGGVVVLCRYLRDLGAHGYSLSRVYQDVHEDAVNRVTASPC